jgi:membrane protease YdiL (CAAX protease family)
MTNQTLYPSSRTAGRTHSIGMLQFFGLTYLLSWLIWIPLDLSHFGIGPFSIPEATSNLIRLFGVLMPAVTALILTWLAGRGAAVKNLLSRLKIWRVSWNWWAASALVQPGLLVLAALVYNAFWGNPPVSRIPIGTASAFIVNAVFLLIATLGEEIGWRGVALPGLQAKHNSQISSLILGLLWSAWHIPFWLLLDTYDQFGLRYLFLNFMLILPLTFYLTWVFNHTRMSLLFPVVLHVTFNIVNTALLPVTLNLGAFSLLVLLEWIVWLLIIRNLDPVAASANSGA